MFKIVKKAKVVKIEIKRVQDEYPDISFLETTPEGHYGENGSEWDHVSKEDVKNVVEEYGSIWNACVEYARQDEERLNAYKRGEWEMICIKAVATVHIPIFDNAIRVHTIDSGGLWGVESDNDESYLQEIEKDQINEVKEILRILCVENVDSCKIITGRKSSD